MGRRGPMQGGSGSDHSGESSPEGTHINSSSSMSRATIPCAACKLLRRKCVQECPFAPYFPPSEPHKFASVHKIFGASNVSKMLMEVPENRRADVANSLVYEANARIRDPVYGCLGAISALQQEAQSLQSELHAVRTQIMRYRFQESAMAAAASAHHHLTSSNNNNNNNNINSNINSSFNNINVNTSLTPSTSSPPPLIAPLAFKIPSSATHGSSSLASSQTSTVTSGGGGEHYTIGSPADSMAIDLKPEHYWSQLHQSC